MKSLMTNQRYLKAFLLLALAANVSWEPMMKQLKSTGLASITAGERMGSAGVVPSSNRASSGQTGVDAEKQKADAAARQQHLCDSKLADCHNRPSAGAAQPVVAKDNQAAAKTDEKTEKDYLPPICGVKYRVEFLDKTEAGEVQTIVVVKRPKKDASNAEDYMTDLTISFPGTVGVNLGKRASIDPEIIQAVKLRHKDECANEPKETVAKTDDKDKDKKSAIDETDKKECRVDDDGAEIDDGRPRITCLLTRLGQEAAKKEEEKGDRIAEIKDIVKRLIKGQIKALIMSDKEKDQDLAKSMIVKTTAHLKALKSNRSYRFSRSELEEVDNLLALVDGLETGLKVEVASDKLLKDEKSLQTKVDDNWRLLDKYPNVANQSARAQLLLQHQYLQNQISQALGQVGVPKLQDYAARGILDQDDTRDFLKTYLQLENEMYTMNDPARLNCLLSRFSASCGSNGLRRDPIFDAQLKNLNIQAPSDIFQVRGELFRNVTSIGRGWGMNLSNSVPTLNTASNLGNFGTPSGLATTPWNQPGQSAFGQPNILGQNTFGQPQNNFVQAPQSNLGIVPGRSVMVPGQFGTRSL